jgi:hypothetical protein
MSDLGIAHFDLADPVRKARAASAMRFAVNARQSDAKGTKMRSVPASVTAEGLFPTVYSPLVLRS